MRRPAAIVLGLAVLVTAATPTLAAAPSPGGVRVTIETAGGPAGSRFLSQDVLAAHEDLIGRCVSAAALAELAGIPRSGVTLLRIARVGRAGTVDLSPAELAAGVGAFDPEHNRTTATQFSRVCNLDDSDEIVPPTGDPLAVTVSTAGGPLTVQASADRTVIPSGGAVALTGAASDAVAGAPLTYSWSFGDQEADDAGPSTKHVFVADGIYFATLTATAPDGSAGISQPIRLQVGPAASGDGVGAVKNPIVKPPIDTAGGGTGGSRAPTRGPAKSSGTSAVDLLTGGRTQNAGRAKPHASSTRTAKTGATAATASPAAPSPTSSTPAKAGPVATVAPPPPPPPASLPSRDTVRGLLLVNARTGAPVDVQATPDPASTAQDRAAVRAASGEPGSGTWIAVLAGLVLLLALGAARERRGRHRALPGTS